jgi:AraC family transcriptional regulator
LGKIATKILASGDGWTAGDVVCASGPCDRPYEEQHGTISICVALEGSFQYRSAGGSEVMSPGSLLLGNDRQYFECAHEYGTGDRCIAFHYTPEFFERGGGRPSFPIHRLPPLPELAPWVVEANLAVRTPERADFEELAYGMAMTVEGLLETGGKSQRTPTAADERRVSSVLRFIEVNLGEPLPLSTLAAVAKMSAFYFLRAFKQVAGVTPHHYILRARLREAAMRLKSRSDAVLDVALEAGFRDLSNFNRAFRAEFGTSPRIYRRHSGTLLQAVSRLA